MGHVRSKTRLLDQILEKPCVCCRDQILGLILIKLGQSVCLNESCTFLKMCRIGSKPRSLGQTIEDGMLVTKGL